MEKTAIPPEEAWNIVQVQWWQHIEMLNTKEFQNGAATALAKSGGWRFIGAPYKPFNTRRWV